MTNVVAPLNLIKTFYWWLTGSQPPPPSPLHELEPNVSAHNFDTPQTACPEHPPPLYAQL